MDKVSIIVPVFNAEQYLRECLTSIKNQIFKNFEVVLVDDCSTDTSSRILKEFVESDSRFVCFRNERNQGLSYSRNVGMKYSTGNLFFFVDADDVLDVHCLEILVDVLEMNNADISLCAYEMFEHNVSDMIINKNLSSLLSHSELMKELAICSKIQNFAWGKLYKKELFDNVSFPIGRYYEDICTIPFVFERARLGVYVDSKLYYYRQNAGSITKTLDKKKINDFFKSMETKAVFFNNKYPEIFKYMSQSFFELFYLRKKMNFKKNDIDNYRILASLYMKAVRRASFKQKIKYLLAVLWE